jgi:hypothetical protein
MRHELEIWKTQTAGKLSQKYYDYALTLVNKDFFCTQCKSPLAIKEKAFHSQYVTCAYCKTVNTFIPESKFCQAGWAVVDDLATYRVFDLFKEFRRWHNLPRRRDEAEAAAQREGTMKATLVFVQAMLKERIELMPEAAENYDFDLKTKMRQIGFNENEYSI